MPVDILPEFSQPYVEVQTEALGLSAAEVEALITVPLEADMLNGAPWLEEIRSQSIPGLSSIVLVFRAGHRHHARPANGAGAADRSLYAAERREIARHGQPGFVGGPRDDDRLVVGKTVAHRDVGARTLDDRSAIDGRQRRCQRLNLGRAAPATASASRPGEAARIGRPAHAGDQHHRQRSLVLAADVSQCVDPGYIRLYRHAQSTAGCPALVCRSPRPKSWLK